MAPGWIHAPHVVEGRIDEADILLYHASMANDTSIATLHARVVPHGNGSSIIGEFRQGRIDALFMSLVRWFITLLLIGMPAFVTLGILRDDQAAFSPGLVVFLAAFVLAAVLLQPWLRRLDRISVEDTQVVRDFIERAINLARSQAHEAE